MPIRNSDFHFQKLLSFGQKVRRSVLCCVCLAFGVWLLSVVYVSVVWAFGVGCWVVVKMFSQWGTYDGRLQYGLTNLKKICGRERRLFGGLGAWVEFGIPGTGMGLWDFL